MVLLGVGQAGSDATGVMLPVTWLPTTSPWVLWDGHPHSHVVLVLQLAALFPVMFHRGIPILVVDPPPGAGVGPSPGGVEAEKKVEASELLQALSVLQRIMTREDFVKYQVLVAPKPKPGKTREQELADRVKSQHRLRTQETTHRGQIDKLELDLQRHRDMLQGVLSRIRVESEECDDLRAQVAKEQAPPENCETIPPTRSDSQPDEMYLSTVEEESGDESMLMGTSTGAEDDWMWVGTMVFGSVVAMPLSRIRGW